METIRIYHSPWRILLLALASLAFAVAGFFMAIHSPKGFHIVVGWISVVFFGMGGLYMLYSIRKLNRQLVNAQENISTTGTGLKGQELCDLLSERLKRK
ncbi:MAG: hypothetical protein J5971_05825 [Prevotella sp.]|nr:hypothetical protein [Prevotella sp.]